MTVTIDWSYQRPGCFQCQRAQAFLAQADVRIAHEQDAKAQPVLREEALRLLTLAGELHSARGKSLLSIDPRRDSLDEAAQAKWFLRPDGDLRAPALLIGEVLVVGFHPDLYSRFFTPLDVPSTQP